MAEQPVEMPAEDKKTESEYYKYDGAQDNYAGNQAASVKLDEDTNLVKNKLLSELNQFNQNSESVSTA